MSGGRCVARRVLALGFAIPLGIPLVFSPVEAALIGPPIQIGDGVSSWSSVCYNEHSDQYLVVWVDTLGGYFNIRAKLFDQSGLPVSNNYTDIYGQRINASTGAKIGANIPIYVPQVIGNLSTNLDGERCVNATSVLPTGTGVTHVFGLGGSALSGTNLAYNPLTGAGQRGVDDGSGPNNVGLPVRVWGRVTGIDPSGGHFWIDDGSRPVKVWSESVSAPIGERAMSQ